MDHHATDHSLPLLERHCDVAVVGGSAAGLAATLQLARQRRSVIVLDDGQPRNAPAGHVHGYLGREGVTPQQLIADARSEVRSHGAEVLTARVVQVTRTGDRFRVELNSGHAVVARRVLAATGLVDELPDVGGLAAHWGGDVVHCPFCHGYEVRDAVLVQLVTHPLALHTAQLWAGLTDRLTLVVSDDVDDEPALDRLRGGGVTIIRGHAVRVLGPDNGRIEAVELADGTRLPAEAVAITARFQVRAEPFAALGLTTVPHPSGFGDVVETDPTAVTSVPGLYAAGNVTDPSLQVLGSAAAGSWAGAMIAFSLAAEDLEQAARTSPHQADWDARYSGERIWSGSPNGSLVAEVADLPPGRALDVGAGEGGDAVWLAEQGWTVTASDVSTRALARVAEQAQHRELPVKLLHTDANTRDAFPLEAFDLVSMAYGAVPRTADDRGVRNLLGAVAPGGTLVVLAHDLAAMRAHGPRPAFDPDAFVGVDDVAAALAAADGWELEVHETRPRPPGAASTGHVDDVVLRARRTARPRQ